ncbi:MAG TPA: polyhydroxyalkanoate depolymerase [Hyphomonadaceae bacterium]|nr:polyhydroxyalkanoate depolymerase [Hyphomonadaceae bacterium]
MLYTLYELNRAAQAPLRQMARWQKEAFRSPANPLTGTAIGRTAVAAADLFESITRHYAKPEWRINSTKVAELDVPVTPRIAARKTWWQMVHFERNNAALLAARAKARRAEPDPAVLIVAPLSGHYATLLRNTVETFLPDHEVYITDWVDARAVPLYEGRFDLNDYVDAVIDMLRLIGPRAHVVAVCQPGPAVLAAAALLSEAKDPARPATMTIMGSPIDTRRSPTVPNVLAKERPLDWFEKNLVHTLPPPYPGALRRVYPGFVQLASFMNMNWERHVDAHWSFFEHLVEDDDDPIDKHREFYDEYLSVLDLTAEFYLQTVQEVFQEHLLAIGQMRHRGHVVNPAAIEDIALMTVEGEKDDISGIGQTQAAHDLCVNLPKSMQLDHIQLGAGHYGVFSGSRFRREVYPKIRDFITRFDQRLAQAAE